MSAITLTLLKQHQRNFFLLVLLVTVPFVFITLSFYITEDVPLRFLVVEGGQRIPRVAPMPEVHGAIMVPIAVSFLAGITGLFVMIEAVRNDARLLVAGVSHLTIAASRLVIIGVLVAVVTAVSVSVTLINFRPDEPLGFVAGNVLIALTYGFLGAIAAILVGRLGGAYLMFFVPMIDVGIFQDPMFISGDQSFWMKLLPGFGGTRMVLDAGFTGVMDDWVALAAALAWSFGLAAVVLAMFVRTRDAG